MKLNLYDKDLNRIAIIGDRFISCMWSEGYNTTQSFTLELQGTAEYKRKVKPDLYVGRDDRKTLMVIKTVQAKDGKIVASGKQATRCLDDVPFVGTIEAGVALGQSIKDAYDASGKFGGVEFAEPSLDTVSAHQISNKSFLELCEKSCQDTDVGFRVVRSADGIRVEFYQPVADPNLVFSQTFGNLTIDSILLSTENLKNHAIVLGGGEGSERWQVEVDQSDGAQKRSLIVDARDLQREEEETDEAYSARLTARGVEKLLEKQGTWECAFTPLARDFGIRYDLGDILTVLMPDYGVRLQARVARFTQKAQNNKTTTSIEVGTITITR